MKKNKPNSIKLKVICLGIFLLTLCALNLNAAVLYWDNNGTSAPTSGTWDNTSLVWSTSSALSSSLVAWNTADAACFSAGSSTNAITITVNSTITNGGFFNGSLNPPGVPLTISGTGQLYIPSGVQAAASSGGSDHYGTTINCVISGPGQFWPEGANALILNGANTYSGGTVLSGGGGVSFGNNSAFGTGTIYWNAGGFIQPATTSAYTIANAMSHTNNLIETFSGNTGGVTFSGNWALGSTAYVEVENIANTITVSGVISGSANLTFTNKNGAAWTLTGVNTFSGGLTNGVGNLTIGGAGQLGSGTFAKNFLNTGNFIYNSSANQTMSGIISGTGTLTSAGSGTLTLSAANTYTGGTSNTGGTLNVNTIADSGTSAIGNSGTFYLGGGTLQYTGAGSASTSRQFSGISGTTSTINLANGNLTLSGRVTGSGAFTLNKTGSSSLTLANSADNSFLAVNVNGGTLVLNTASTSGVHGIGGTTTIANGAALQLGGSGGYDIYSGVGLTVNSGGTFELNGQSLSAAGISSLSLSGTGGGSGALINNSGTASTLTANKAINLAGNSTIGGSGNITLNGAITNVNSLTYGGSATLTLNGTNTYSGNTIINSGTLVLGANGSISQTAQISIASGATLSVPSAGITLGSGPNQILAGSSSSGTATINAPGQTVTLSSGASLSFVASGSGSTAGQISVSGASANLALNNNAVTVNVSGSALGTGTYRLMSCSGTLSGAAYSAPTITGLGLAAGCLATVVTTGGAAGHVDLVINSTGPAISSQPSSQTACYGQNAVFSVGASGNGDSYYWLKHSNAGWGSAWTVEQSGGGAFLGTATDNNNGNPNCNSFGSYGDINTPSGNSWGLYSTSGSGESLIRSFPAALTNGQVFQIDMDNGFVVNGVQCGFSLHADTNYLFSFYFVGGASDYGYTDSTGNHSTSVGYTQNGLRVTIVVGPGSPATYNLLVQPCGGSVSTYSGTFANAGSPSAVVLYNNNNTGGDNYNLYFNNLYAGGAYDNADNYTTNWAGVDAGDVAIGGENASTMITNSTGGLPVYALVYDNAGVAATSSATSSNTPKALNITGITISNKIYDGTTVAVLNGTVSLGTAETFGSGTCDDGLPFASDSVSITGTPVGTYNSKDVATATNVMITGLSLTGANAANYVLTNVITLPGTITAKTLNVAGTLAAPASKIYDGTAAAAVGGAAALLSAESVGSGSASDGTPYSGDAVSLSGAVSTASYDSKDVTNATLVSFNTSGLGLTGGDSDDYSIGGPITQAASITPKGLSVAGNLSAPASKVYDGTATAAVGGAAGLQNAETAGSGSTSDGAPYSGDAVSLSGSVTAAAYNSKNVATANLVTFDTSGLALSGANISDYSIAGLPLTQAASITAKPLSVAGTLSVPASKIYDGTNTAALTGAAALLPAEADGTGSGTDGAPYSGDSISLSGSVTNAVYNGKDVTNGNLVTFDTSGLSLSGADVADYSMHIPLTQAATITPKTLSVAGTLSVPASKVYDSTATATVGGAAALLSAETVGSGSGSDGMPYSSDSVSLSGSVTVAAYNSKDVSSANLVTFDTSGLSLSGADTDDYSMGLPISQAASITALPVSLTGTRVYDGTTTAAAGILSVANALGGDSVNVASGSATLASADYGAEAISSFGTLALGNNSAGDYTLSGASGSVNITQATLTITANNQSKTYGQTVTFGSGSTNFAAVGLQNGDTVGSVTLACSGGPGNSPVSGSPYTITASAAAGGTFNPANYSITYNNGTLSVGPATLTVTADDFSRAYGAPNPVLTDEYTNFVNGETLATSDVQGSPDLTTDATTNSDIGSYVITNSIGTLTSTNYTLGLVNGTLTVTNALSTNVLVASTNPALPATTVVFTATVSAIAPSTAVPTNLIQFLLDGTNVAASVYPSNGVALYTNSTLSHGYHTIEADYSGDTNAAGDTNIVASTSSVTELINTPPVAAPAAYSRHPNASLQIAVSDLLTNATDADGDALSLVSVGPSTNGATIMISGGNVTYTPPGTNGNVTDVIQYTVQDTFGATNSSTLTITVQSETTSPPVDITGLMTLPNGTVQINFAGQPNYYYLIEATTNLTPPITWTVLSTNQAGTNGLFQYTDLSATNSPTRYYRTAVPPGY